MAPINMLLHKQMVQVNLLALNSITLETVGGLYYTVVTVVTVWIVWCKLHKKQHMRAFFGKSVLKCHLT